MNIESSSAFPNSPHSHSQVSASDSNFEYDSASTEKNGSISEDVFDHVRRCTTRQLQIRLSMISFFPILLSIR